VRAGQTAGARGPAGDERRAGPALVSVNVGQPRTTLFRGEPLMTAIWKRPVAGRVPVRGWNLEGDNQADRSVHGGPDKAVYAYAREDAAWWAAELGRPIEPGTFGENLTTTEIDLAAAVIGEQWAVGSAVLEVSQPRTPCFKLGIRMGDPRFPARFAAAGRPGAYLRIVAEGDIATSDPITVLSRPAHGVTVRDVERAYHADRSGVDRLLEAPELPASWAEWARRVSRRRAPRPGPTRRT